MAFPLQQLRGCTKTQTMILTVLLKLERHASTGHLRGFQKRARFPGPGSAVRTRRGQD